MPVLRADLPPAVEAFVRLALSCRNVEAVYLVPPPATSAPPGPSSETLSYHERIRESDLLSAHRHHAKVRRARLRSGRAG